MTRPMSDADSDSAPEDVTFMEARDDALEQIKTVQKAAMEKKKVKKEQNKRKQEMMKEQKEKKKKKLVKLESKKLPTDLLDVLSDTANIEKGDAGGREKKQTNKKTTFFEEEDFFGDDDEDEEGETNSGDFIALETVRTNFKVVSEKDLGTSSFRMSQATGFREKMLFGSRVRREPHMKQQLCQQKILAGGKGVRVKVALS